MGGLCGGAKKGPQVNVPKKVASTPAKKGAAPKKQSVAEIKAQKDKENKA